MKPFKPTRVFEPKTPLAKQPARSPEAAATSSTMPSARPSPPLPAAPKPPSKPESDQQPPQAQPQRPAVERPALAPAGVDYVVSIARATVFDKPKLGLGLEIVFVVADGEHKGSIARGRFPFTKPGLAVLVAAAIGEQAERWAAAIADRLLGRKILADIVHSGAGRGEALVRNIRPLESKS